MVLGKKWREKFHVGDILAAIRPLDDICSTLGLNPLDGSSRLSLGRFAYCTTFLALTTSFYVFVDVGLSKSDDREGIYNGALYAGDLTTMAAIWLTLAARVRQRKRIAKALDRLRRVDRILSELGIPFPYSYGFMSGTLLLVCVHLLMTAVQWTVYHLMDKGTYFLVPKIYTLLMHLASCHLMVLPIFLERHYGHIKDGLEYAKSELTYHGNMSKFTEITKICNELGNLCDSVEAINCRQLLLMMMAIFVNIIGRLFVITRIHLDSAENSTTLLGAVIWIFFHFYQALVWILTLLVIVRPCYACQRKAKEFTTALYNMMIEDKAKVLMENEKLQLHMMMKREVQFTACGFFPLDNTLIHSIVAAAATYIVMLIQFGPK